MEEEVDDDSHKEWIDYVVGEVNNSPYELEAFIAFLLSRHLFEGYPNEKILDRYFPLAVKLANGYYFPLFLYFLDTLYGHLDRFVSYQKRSWGRSELRLLRRWLSSTSSYRNTSRTMLLFLNPLIL